MKATSKGLGFRVFYHIQSGESDLDSNMSADQQHVQSMRSSQAHTNVHQNETTASRPLTHALPWGHIRVTRGHVGIMENKNGNHDSMLGLYRDNAKKMETTIIYILGLYWDNGKENGNYYSIYWGHIGITDKKMETTMD